MWLGTFDSARVFYAAAWSFGGRCCDMNFLEIVSRTEAKMLALEPRLMLAEDQR
jgi:hypothetical protein